MPPTFHTGCPFWSFPEWAGTLFSADARPKDFLGQYARVFDAVEGNTTFYQTPEPSRVRGWCDQTPPGFRFCFKLPRTITHDAQLVGVARETTEFLSAVSVGEERLGPILVQLPPAFGPVAVAELGRFLATLPAELDYAVEVRHPMFFQSPSASAELDQLLDDHACSRVSMDTRPLREGDSSHPDILEARHRKPDLPLPARYTGPHPIARVVFHPDHAPNEPYLSEWGGRIQAWVEEGRRPYLFIHTPSNRGTPELARRLHGLIVSEVGGDPLPPFPGECGETVSGQLRLL